MQQLCILSKIIATKEIPRYNEEKAMAALGLRLQKEGWLHDEDNTAYTDLR
jgi:hypothetical protein